MHKNKDHEDKKWKLYVLICPIERIVRYVGITSRAPEERLVEHICQNKKTNPHKWCWVKHLKDKNFRPEIKIVRSNLTKNQACKLEVNLITIYRFILGNKLTNLHEGGNVPPILIGIKNPNAIKRPFKIWNKTTNKEWQFNYIFEAANKLNIPNSSISGLLNLNGKKTSFGYYGCYLEQIKNWQPPTDKRYKIRPFKIWNSKEEYKFKCQSEAVKKLGIRNINLLQTLQRKRNTVSGYYACYLDEFSSWPDSISKKGKKHKKFKKKKI